MPVCGVSSSSGPLQKLGEGLVKMGVFGDVLLVVPVDELIASGAQEHCCGEQASEGSDNEPSKGAVFYRHCEGDLGGVTLARMRSRAGLSSSIVPATSRGC